MVNKTRRLLVGSTSDNTKKSLPETPSPPSSAKSRVVNPNCPNCTHLFDPPPTRKRKCPSCGVLVFVRTRISDRQRYVVTEEEARAIDAEWHTFNAGPSGDDKWAILNQQLSAAMKDGSDQEMARIYFEMALQLFEEGRDHRPIAQECRKAELRGIQATSVEVVKILTAGNKSCPACHVLGGKQFTIADAFEQMPLPEKGCDRLAEDNRHGGWCRCMYVADFG